LQSEEFFSLLATDQEAALVNLSVYSELRRVNELFVSRRGRGRYRFAVEGRTIWRRPASGDLPAAELHSLAPSDEAIRRAVQRLGQLLTPETATRRRLRGDPNEMSIALWVTCGDDAVLLGGDVAVGPGPDCGWNAVLSSSTCPSDTASVYKVAHHGSPDADHPRVWSTLLDPAVVAIVAPYHRGSHPRPDEADRRRIAAEAAESYMTAPSHDFMPNRYRAMAAQIMDMGRRISLESGSPGQIRMRKAIGSSLRWSVQLDPPAQPLV
jgi:hypothetical protein